MSYNRARLLLGMSGVGVWVLLSCFMLVFPPEAYQLLLLYLVLSVPFDLLGGQILPRCFGQKVTALGKWLPTYLRTVILHTTLLVSIGLSLLLAGQLGWERPVGLLWLAALIAFQPGLLRLSGALPKIRTHLLEKRRVLTIDSLDQGFTGGVAGWPGQERLYLPACWSEEVRHVALRRRLAVIKKGARSLGLIVAFTWNAGGLWLATLGPVSSSRDLTRIALLSTLWSFLGLLVLPSLARRGVFWADKMTSAEVGRETFLAYLAAMPDETQRARPLSEPVFYPIPSQQARLSNLDKAPDLLPRPWYPARMALYLSIGGLGLLSRAVHCNSGRPALWFMPPCD